MVSLGLPACLPRPRAATPQEVRAYCSHLFRGRSAEEVLQAGVIALKLQGYEVVTTEPRVRTEPKLVGVSAYGDRWGASAYATSVAFDLSATETEGGTVAFAAPSVTVNGMPDGITNIGAAQMCGPVLTELNQQLAR